VTDVFNVTTELTKLIEYIHLFELDRKIQNTIKQTDGDKIQNFWIQVNLRIDT